MGFPTKVVSGERTYRIEHSCSKVVKSWDGEVQVQRMVNLRFFTGSGTKALGFMSFEAIAEGFKTLKCYPADEEVDRKKLLGRPNAWWLDNFKKDKSHPLAGKVELSPLLALWLASDTPPALFGANAEFYLCPAPYNAADEPARLKLLAHYEKHLGSRLMRGAKWLAQIPNTLRPAA